MVITMSKATETRATIQAYILSVVESSDFEDCSYFTKCETREEKISFLKGRFFSEYGYNVKRQGEQKALIGWLQGLALGIEYTYNGIEQMMIKWGLLKPLKNGKYSEKACWKAHDEYWNRLSMAILMMFKEIK